MSESEPEIRPQPDLLPEFKVEANRPGFAATLAWSAGLLFTLFLIVLFVSFSFGHVAFESHTPDELYPRVVEGRADVKRMAVAEWAQQAALDSNLGPNSSQTESLIKILSTAGENRSSGDDSYYGGIAAVLGFSKAPDLAAQGLYEFLKATQPGDLADVQIYALLSIARLKVLVPEGALLDRALSPDVSIRKTTAFILGQRALLDQGKTESLMLSLHKLMEDSSEAVRWNATLALARLRDNSGIAGLNHLLSEALAAKTLTSANLDLYRQVILVAVEIGDSQAMDRVKKISQEHPNLQLRQSAKELIK